MLDVNYAYQKLGRIIYILATENGDIRNRLLLCDIEFLLISDDAIPEDLKTSWFWIKDKLTNKGNIDVPYLQKESAFFNTVKQLRKKEGKEVAIQLYEVYNSMRSSTIHF